MKPVRSCWPSLSGLAGSGCRRSRTGARARGVADGRTIEQVVLHPLTISRTDVGQPAAAGCRLGRPDRRVAPLDLGRARARIAGLVAVFAGFCCLANGLYIGVGSLSSR